MNANAIFIFMNKIASIVEAHLSDRSKSLKVVVLGGVLKYKKEEQKKQLLAQSKLVSH